MKLHKSAPPRGAKKGQNSSSKGATFASSISACWNNTSSSTAGVKTSSKSGGWNKTSSSTTTSTAASSCQQRKTTCLFCPNVVVLPPPALSGQDSPKLQKFVWNLFNHLDIPESELPGQFTREKFPFCSNNCEPLVAKLWKQQQILEEMLRNIEKTVNDIEHAVVDAEILRGGDQAKRPGSSVMAILEQLKFTKLRDLILQGYRNKLFQKQQQSDETAAGQTGIDDDEGEFGEQMSNDNNNGYEMREDERGEERTQIDIEEHHGTTVKRERLDQLEDLTISLVNVNSSSTVPPQNGYAEPPHLPQDNGTDYEEQEEEEQEEQDEYADTLNPEAYNWSVDPRVVAHYNDDNCTLVITNEIDESDETPNLIQVKQEAHAAAVNEYDFDEEPDTSDDIFEMTEKKRRFLFEGVEIYRVSGTGAHSKLDYLQCSLCSYTLNVPKSTNSKASSPYMKMKTHILHIHKKKAGVPKAPRTRELLCIPCNQSFANRKELQEHRAQHPAEFSLECDICGKPMKSGSSQYNLLIHKFSHKNDEERKVSIAAKERGSYNSFLSKKLNMGSAGILTPEAVNRKRRRNVNKKSQPQTPPSSRSLPRPVPQDSGRKKVIRSDGVAGFSTDKPFPCDQCGRRFGRKCHLMRHKMSTHAENLPAPSASSSSQSRRRQRNCANPKSPAVTQAPVPVLKAVANRRTQSFGNVAPRGVLQTPQQVSVAIPRASLGELTDRGQRVTAGDGTVVVVKQEVLLNLLRNNIG